MSGVDSYKKKCAAIANIAGYLDLMKANLGRRAMDVIQPQVDALRDTLNDEYSKLSGAQQEECEDATEMALAAIDGASWYDSNGY